MWEQSKQKHVVICWISYFLYLFKKSHLKWNLKLKCRKELWACSLCVIEAFAVNGGYCVGVIVDGNLFCQIWKIKFSFEIKLVFVLVLFILKKPKHLIPYRLFSFWTWEINITDEKLDHIVELSFSNCIMNCEKHSKPSICWIWFL